jgi:hypothetical protein
MGHKFPTPVFLRPSHLTQFWQRAVQRRLQYYFFKIHWNIIHHLRLGLPSGLFVTQVSPSKLCQHLTSPLTCHMHRLPHSSWFDHPNNIWCGVQVMKLLFTLFPPLPPTLSQIGPNIFFRHPIFEIPQPIFFPQYDRPSFTPIQNNSQNRTSVYINFYIYGHKTGKQKTLDRVVVVGILWVQ